MNGPDFGDIREEMQSRIEALVHELLPDGHRNGAYWIAKNPTRADRTAGSMWVRLTPEIGVWKEEAEGKTGDIIKLVMYLGALPDYRATKRWCLNWLGWGGDGAPTLTPEERKKREEMRAAAQRQQAHEDAERLAKQSKQAFSLWLNAPKLDPDTFPHTVLFNYLISRALDLRKARLPGSIHFDNHAQYLMSDGKKINRPCMVALMSDANGKAQAIHRTWLERDGSGKLNPLTLRPDLDPKEARKRNPARKIWPNYNGAVIRLAKGEGNLSPEMAAKKERSGPLILTEGIEDGLAVMLACPKHRVWAAGTLGNMANIPLLPCVSSVVICADNDWNNEQAIKQLNSVASELQARGADRGIQISIARSPKGKDANDLLLGNVDKSRDSAPEPTNAAKSEGLNT